jgi:COP9 signalosome complex subunit 4
VQVLRAAVNEHNVLAASKIYTSINLDELALLISLTSQQTEQVVCRMIAEGRLKASIDQRSNMLDFAQSSFFLLILFWICWCLL